MLAAGHQDFAARYPETARRGAQDSAARYPETAHRGALLNNDRCSANILFCYK